MGEAKRRGTLQDRRSAAIKRDGIEREERRRLEMERLAAITEEERQKARDRQIVFAQVMAVCLSMGHVPYFTSRY